MNILVGPLKLCVFCTNWFRMNSLREAGMTHSTGTRYLQICPIGLELVGLYCLCLFVVIYTIAPGYIKQSSRNPKTTFSLQGDREKWLEEQGLNTVQGKFCVD